MRAVSIRVRPSVLSREFDRIDRKYRSSPIGYTHDTDSYLNTYAAVKQRNLCLFASNSKF